MKKHFLFLLIALFSAVMLYSNTVDFITARKAAENFFKAKMIAKSGDQAIFPKISDSYTKYTNDQPCYHVFNFENGGYVIIAADDAVRPVLAFSLNTSCPENTKNTSFLWWMEQYEKQIVYARNSNLKASNDVADEWERLTDGSSLLINQKSVKAIEPMLTSIWNQDAFYNEQCPVDPMGPGGHCFAGCVATAIGQVMNYYRYPQQGTGSYSYTHPEYGFQSVDFSSQFYNWDEMATELTGSNHEIANLLYNIGVSVDMNYGPDGSGMYNHKGAYTMRTYFGYDPDTRYYFRDSVDGTFNWVDTVIMHLDAGMPLYYAGWSDTIFEMGHAFVCDGYQDEVYFHFNWGWGGYADGYFNIDNLIVSGADFTLLHEMIAYSYPETGYPYYCDGQKVLTTLRGTIDDGSGPLHDYGNEFICEWLISPEDSVSSILLNFLKFDVAAGDEVIVFDGIDDSAPVLGSFSGSSLPASVTGTSGKMLVRFISDETITAPGFLAEYTGDQPDYCTFSYQYHTTPTGTVSDGSNGFNYYNDEYCRWIIEPEGATNILITFTKLDTEDEVDYLRLYDITNAVAIDTFSGNEIPEPFIVYTSAIKISFITNETIRGDGWALNYESNVVSVSDSVNYGNIAIYPNPAHAYLNITTDRPQQCQLLITDLQGRQLINKNMNGQNETIDVSGLSSGIYFIELNRGGARVVRKIVVE